MSTSLFTSFTGEQTNMNHLRKQDRGWTRGLGTPAQFWLCQQDVPEMAGLEKLSPNKTSIILRPRFHAFLFLKVKSTSHTINHTQSDRLEHFHSLQAWHIHLVPKIICCWKNPSYLLSSHFCPIHLPLYLGVLPLGAPSPTSTMPHVTHVTHVTAGSGCFL